MEHSTPERYLEGNVNVLRGAVAARLVGVDPSAEVHPEAQIVAPVRIGAGALVGPGAEIGPDAVIGRGARVAAGVRVCRSVVWSGATVEADAIAAIVTPRQRITATV